MQVRVIGLGPAGLERLPEDIRARLLDPAVAVIVRTLNHPAAADLKRMRHVTSCDDLYESESDFDAVYNAIVERVLAAASVGPTIYAVPGSPLVGEFAVARMRGRAAVEIVAAESFIEAVLGAVGYDPLDRGLRVLNGYSLPEPLLIQEPTVVAHLDTPVILAETGAAIARVVGEGSRALVVIDAGGENQRIEEVDLERIDGTLAGIRTTLFLDPEAGGMAGVIQTMARLRRECPWDRKQTHESLVKNLVEETHELVDAIASAHEGAIEDELGDVLLQVLFHSAMSAETGGFGIEDVAENLRQKLVRRHPHIFGDVVADTPEKVKANWDEIKAAERGAPVTGSTLDGVPAGMPALERAAKLQRKAARVGFDWPDVAPVVAKVAEELREIEAVLDDQAAVAAEVGDLLFAVVNLARHLQVDPELALIGSIQRFVRRFQTMETMGSFEGLSLAEMDARWEMAKRSDRA